MKNNKALAIILVILIILFAPRLLIKSPELIAFCLVEAFITLFYYIFVITPLSYIIKNDDHEKMSKKLLAIRVILIIIMYLIIKDKFIIIDANILVYGGVFLFIISIFKKNPNKEVIDVNRFTQVETTTQVICSNCNSLQDSTNKFCTNCGVELTNKQALELSSKKMVRPIDYDPIYSNTEEVLLEKFIEKELAKAGFEKATPLIPQNIKKKKNNFTILLSILIAVYISLIFFHFPIYTYIIGFIIILIFIIKTQKYDFMTYLKKEIKSRPQEKISNIIMSTKSSLTQDNQKVYRILGIIASIILPLIFFMNPRIMYEKVDNGYAVRFYTFGLTNFKTAEIPEKHKGKDVVSLRGNAFSNMPFLKEVKLPDTITEIRGQAFKNDINLTEVNIPSNLDYLGGGAFYNCTSITEIELPNTLTFLGGESFYNAVSLEKIKLSDNLTEIRGNSFENCSSLESITIPDKVERIGGHAFYGNSSLKEVNLTENSSLNEIGSSAFRLCSKLSTITIPKTTIVNERAFKESPTKVKRFGDVDYDNLVDRNKYKQYSFMYLQNIGDTQKVNKYISTAIIYNTDLTLVDAKLVNNYYEYTLSYTDVLGTTEFTLGKDSPYKVINDNLVVSIGSKYALTSYNSGFSVNVYYN